MNSPKPLTVKLCAKLAKSTLKSEPPLRSTRTCWRLRNAPSHSHTPPPLFFLEPLLVGTAGARHSDWWHAGGTPHPPNCFEPPNEGVGGLIESPAARQRQTFTVAMTEVRWRAARMGASAPRAAQPFSTAQCAAGSASKGCAATSMRHQYRHGHLRQHITSCPAQHDLAQSRMPIAAHDQQVSIHVGDL
jgi:hypothetical protein